VRLAVLRDQAWRELERLRQEEGRLLASGCRAEHEGDRRRLASMLIGVRREARHRTRMAEVLDRQIAVLAGHLHSLELLALGTMVSLPTAEELTAAADAAQKTIDDVQEAWQTARATEPDASALESEQEAAILREFERTRDAELSQLEVKPAEPAVGEGPTAGPRRVRERPEREAQME
jgi:hypothetical protein